MGWTVLYKCVHGRENSIEARRHHKNITTKHNNFIHEGLDIFYFKSIIMSTEQNKEDNDELEESINVDVAFKEGKSCVDENETLKVDSFTHDIYDVGNKKSSSRRRHTEPPMSLRPTVSSSLLMMGKHNWGVLRRLSYEKFFNSERVKLMLVKSCFAIIWGIMNATVLLTTEKVGGSRYATSMTGNVIALSADTVKAFGGYYKSNDDDVDASEDVDISTIRIAILFTLGMMFCYVVGAFCFNVCWFVTSEDKRNRVVTATIIITIILGAISDLMRMSIDKRIPYFCFPISMVAGILASGYCTAINYGVCTDQCTGHFSKVGMYSAKLLTKGCSNEDKEDYYMSMIIITFFFIGALIGWSFEPWMYSNKFDPIYTIVTFVLSCNVKCHYHLHLQYHQSTEN